MDTAVAMGRRERKKAATRHTIANAAMRLFLAHGYDLVSVRDIAEEADVSPTTLFAHFPSKEALVFDQDLDRERELVAAVRDRPPHTLILDALHSYVLTAVNPANTDVAELQRFLTLIESSADLQAYALRMWTRHAAALAEILASETGAPTSDPTCRAFACFVLQIPSLVRGQADPPAAAHAAFALLENGWPATPLPRTWEPSEQ